MSIQPVRHLTSTLGEPAGVFLVDLSWLLHRSFYAAPDLTANVGGVDVSIGAVHGTLNSILALANRRKNYAIILCVDGKDPKRIQVAPGYKGDRNDTHKSEIYSAQRTAAKIACQIPGVIVAHHEHYEADDLIWTFSQRMLHLGPVLIFSRDKDLTQCLTDVPSGEVGSVRMFEKLTAGGFVEMGAEYPEEKFGVPPCSVAMFRAITGDTSDNLKGYPRFPKKLAAEVARRFLDPEDLLTAPEHERADVYNTKAQKDRVHQLIKDPGPLRRNYFVMKLKDVPKPNMFTINGGDLELVKYKLKAIGEKIRKLRSLADVHVPAP